MFFFFNDPATTEIYTLSLHDALPISKASDPPDKDKLERLVRVRRLQGLKQRLLGSFLQRTDRKSTRLNSSHVAISYAVFCLKKKKKKYRTNNKTLHSKYNIKPEYDLS